MAARYVEVTREEFERLMVTAGFYLVECPGVVELVWERKVERENRSGAGLTPLSVLDLAVRVYSTVPRDRAVARDVGVDAIRVQVVHVPTSKIVWSATRTHRTQKWAERTVERMRDAWRAAKQVPTCPVCRTRPMAVRRTRDRTRQFLSCVGWPECRGSQRYEERAEQ